ncbi:MAG: uracil-DNA glycosylase family protein [Myxococcota bacterium]
MALSALLNEIRACRECEASLPLGPRPVVQLGSKARLVIVGQAPGTKVHESGTPWDDPSGDHLREWLAIDRRTFYDADKVALVPMGFCYPGKKAGGDAPPRKECAPLWHERVFAELPKDHLLVLAGQYAHSYYLGPKRKKTLTETVRAYDEYLPRCLPVPHPSWRSKIWMKKNPWFEDRNLPALRSLVAERAPKSL